MPAALAYCMASVNLVFAWADLRIYYTTISLVLERRTDYIMTKNAVIYARFSSDKQREESIDGQIRECRAFAEANEINIINTYIDRAMSARTDQRPSFLQMVKDSAKHLFDYVIVYQLDRFSRSRYDSAIYKHRLKKNGVKVLSAKENIKDDPSGILLESVIEGMAEYYSAELSQKVKRGMTENLLEGKWIGGIVPFGYELTSENKLAISPATGHLVPEIYDKYLSGIKTTDILSKLNSLGIKTQRRCNFTRNSLNRILKNQIYTGTFTWAGTSYPEYAPALITQEQYTAMQNLFESRKRKSNTARRVSPQYALTGKIYCGTCGLPMTGYCGKSHTGTTYYYYQCSSKNNKSEKAARSQIACDAKNISRDKLEKLVLDTTISILKNKDAVKCIADQCMTIQKAKLEHKPAEQLRLESQIKEIEKRLKNSVKAVENGLISQTITNNIETYEKQLTELNAQLDGLKLETHIIPITEEAVIYYLNQLTERANKKDGYSLDTFDDFIRRVVVTGKRVDIYYNYTAVPNILENPAVKMLRGSSEDYLVTR